MIEPLASQSEAWDLFTRTAAEVERRVAGALLAGVYNDPQPSRLPWLVLWPCGHWARYQATYGDREQPGEVARRVHAQGCPCTRRPVPTGGS